MEEGRLDQSAASGLTHYAESGQAQMVDVGAKQETRRRATAHALVKMTPEVIAQLHANPKGDPLEVARIAGIMGAKKTSELIPMCHPLALSHVSVECEVIETGVEIFATVGLEGKTGVEMEALTAVTIAALTVYDMTKALDKCIEIQDVYLVEKTGGKSGDFHR